MPIRRGSMSWLCGCIGLTLQAPTAIGSTPISTLRCIQRSSPQWDPDDGALASHYETRGRAEGRIASLGAFVRALNMPPEAVPINFDESEYYELNADLGSAFPHTFFHAIRHYLESGIRERRRYSYSQCYIDAPWQAAAKIVAVSAPAAEADAHKVACLVHVGRSEPWPGLRAACPSAGRRCPGCLRECARCRVVRRAARADPQ